MNISIYYIATLAVGLIAGAYLPFNSRFAMQIGSPLLATAIFFFVGALSAAATWFYLNGPSGFSALKQANPAYFLLGLISFCVILSSTILIPKIGPGGYAVFIIAGQITAGLFLSHFGIAAPIALQITPVKIIGALMVIGGAALISYSEMDQRDRHAGVRTIMD